MTLLALDSRWRRFNDPNRACPCCGRRFSGIFDIGFDAPDAWPHGERLGEDDLDIGDERLRWPDGFSFGPWTEVPEPVFRAYLATVDNPDQPFGPAEGLLANALPLFEDEAESAVTLTLPDPSQRPRLTATDGPLAEAQAQGISFDDLLEIYAACGDDIRPHLAAD